MRAGLGIGGDQLALAVDADRAEVLVLGNIQSPDLLQFAADPVAVGDPLAVLVEPEMPFDG